MGCFLWRKREWDEIALILLIHCFDILIHDWSRRNYTHRRYHEIIVKSYTDYYRLLYEILRLIKWNCIKELRDMSKRHYWDGLNLETHRVGLTRWCHWSSSLHPWPSFFSRPGFLQSKGKKQPSWTYGECLFWMSLQKPSPQKTPSPAQQQTQDNPSQVVITMLVVVSSLHGCRREAKKL